METETWSGTNRPQRVHITESCSALVARRALSLSRPLPKKFKKKGFGPDVQRLIRCPGADAWTRAVASLDGDWKFFDHQDPYAARHRNHKTLIGFGTENYSTSPGIQLKNTVVGVERARPDSFAKVGVQSAYPPINGGASAKRRPFEAENLHGGPYVKARIRTEGASGAYYGQVRNGSPDGFGMVIVPGRFGFVGFFRAGLPDGWGARVSLIPRSELSPRDHLRSGHFREGYLVGGREQYRQHLPAAGLTAIVKFAGGFKDGLYHGEGKFDVYLPRYVDFRHVREERGRFASGHLVAGTRTYSEGRIRTEVQVSDAREHGEAVAKTGVNDLQPGQVVLIDGEALAVLETNHISAPGMILLGGGKMLQRRWDRQVTVLDVRSPRAKAALKAGASYWGQVKANRIAASEAQHQRQVLIRARQVAGKAADRRASQAASLRTRTTGVTATTPDPAANWNAYETRVRNGAKLGWFNPTIQY